jgi:hypothetical protein
MPQGLASTFLADQNHHPREQTQGVEIHPRDRLLLIQHPCRDHQAGTQPGHDGTVYPFGNNNGIGRDKKNR